MMSSDKRIIIRLCYFGLWLVLIGCFLLKDTKTGNLCALFITIIYFIVLYADAKQEHLEEVRKKERKRLDSQFRKELRAAYEYKPRKMEG